MAQNHRPSRYHECTTPGINEPGALERECPELRIVEQSHTPMKDTVNEALRRASSVRDARVAKALDRLGRREFAPREQAWR